MSELRLLERLLRQLTIRQRLIWAFVLLLLMLLGVAAVAGWQMVRIERSGGSAVEGVRLLAAACAGVAVLQFIFCYLVVASIVRPVKVAMKSARKVGAGDLGVHLRPEGRDELAELFRGLNEMTQNLRGVVADVAAGAERVASTSDQIAQGNLDLSQRTEEQASTLEETASSLEQLTATVAQNAATARQASQLAVDAAGTARRGGEVVEQVVSTMDGISDASRRIADIIGVIDGIAFQTNILALNAAVEAARAGEQGRGFAVVAAEVRSLAQRSAAAAREIKALIADSTQKVQAGGALVDAAGHTMVEVVLSFTKVSDLVAEIAAASSEQSEGIAQVNAAVGQMDRVVQQNAALVEEASAATESMKEQSATLLRQVARFRLGAPVGAEPATARRPVAARVAAPVAPVAPAPAAPAPQRAARPLPPAAAAAAAVRRPAPIVPARRPAPAGDWKEF